MYTKQPLMEMFYNSFPESITDLCNFKCAVKQRPPRRIWQYRITECTVEHLDNWKNNYNYFYRLPFRCIFWKFEFLFPLRGHVDIWRKPCFIRSWKTPFGFPFRMMVQFCQHFLRNDKQKYCFIELELYCFSHHCHVAIIFQGSSLQSLVFKAFLLQNIGHFCTVQTWLSSTGMMALHWINYP